jgi:putative transposase
VTRLTVQVSSLMVSHAPDGSPTGGAPREDSNPPLGASSGIRTRVMLLSDREQSFQFLLHDRDSKFSHAFDEVFRSEGIRIIRTPIRAPNANAYAERWVGTLSRECLDRILIINRRHLEYVLRLYTTHYNQHRPRRSLSLQPPGEQPAAVHDRVFEPHEERRPVKAAHRADQPRGGPLAAVPVAARALLEGLM